MELVIVIVVAAGAFAVYRAYQASRHETSEARTVASLPPSVQRAVGSMVGDNQAAFFNEFQRKKKKRSVAYIAWFLLGWHYLYVGKIGMQFAFWFTVGGLGVWWFVDLFRMPSIVRGANELIARQALQTLAVAEGFNPRSSGDTEPPKVGEGS